MEIEHLAHGVGPHGLTMAYTSHGDDEHPAVVLITGLGAQLNAWPPDLVAALVRQGLRVIAIDNRDTGRSTHFTSTHPVDFAALVGGDVSSAPYDLYDMADDTVGLFDSLGLPAAHVVGASMGAGIAQCAAIKYPQRVTSLTTMMWTTGESGVGHMHPATEAFVFGGAPPTTEEEVVARAVRSAAFLTSPAYPIDVAEVADRARAAFARAHDPWATARTGSAVIATGDRTSRLRDLDVPTLVIHGTADTMVDPSGGRATAAAIPGARLELIEGMGHSLPRPLRGRIAELIGEIVAEGERRRTEKRVTGAVELGARR